MQVFLSYWRGNSTFVRRLAESLEGRDGDSVAGRPDEFAATDEDRWRRSIMQGIRESAALVVVLSPDSVSSGQVAGGLSIAAETKRRIIPIIFRPCDLPDGFQFELAGVQRIDFSEQPYESALDQLVRRIGVLPPPENVWGVLARWHPHSRQQQGLRKGLRLGSPRRRARRSSTRHDHRRRPATDTPGRSSPLACCSWLGSSSRSWRPAPPMTATTTRRPRQPLTSRS